eukprot:3992427-Prymnesium_polylepis.1
MRWRLRFSRGDIHAVLSQLCGRPRDGGLNGGNESRPLTLRASHSASLLLATLTRQLQLDPRSARRVRPVHPVKS